MRKSRQLVVVSKLTLLQLQWRFREQQNWTTVSFLCLSSIKLECKSPESWRERERERERERVLEKVLVCLGLESCIAEGGEFKKLKWPLQRIFSVDRVESIAQNRIPVGRTIHNSVSRWLAHDRISCFESTNKIKSSSWRHLIKRWNFGFRSNVRSIP